MQINEQEYQNVVSELQNQLEIEKGKTNQLAQSQLSIFNHEEQENLIRWQLDLKEDMDRIYHLLKGHKLEIDQQGNLYYIEQKDPNLQPFNEFGVQLIMNVMAFYLNRNTILSNYDDDVINWKVYDLGNELADLIFNRYEDMMITITSRDREEVKDHLQDKIKLYPMIVRELIDTVHSAYLRAYNGGERESLRTARMVSQSENMGGNPMTNQGGGMKLSRRWYNPATW